MFNRFFRRQTFEDVLFDVDADIERESQKEARQAIKEAAKSRATSLEVYWYGFAELPTQLWKLTELESLKLNLRHMRSLPANIGTLTKLQKLSVAGTHFANLPLEITELPGLVDLSLSGEKMTRLDLPVVMLPNLKTLSIYSTGIVELPELIGQLASLDTLLGFNNPLVTLPAEIGQLTSLDRILLSENELEWLPASIGQLKQLTRLHLAKNQLTTLPPEIGQLSHLSDLDVHNNKLSSLPVEIGELQNLVSLDVSHNQLTALPPEIGALPRLRQLKVDGNPIENVPVEILQQGNEAVLQYLRSLSAPAPSTISAAATTPELPPTPAIQPPALEAARTERLVSAEQPDPAAISASPAAGSGVRRYLSKLMLVGEGGVGKTSLICALLGDAFDAGEETTRGMAIRHLTLPHPNEDAQMTLRVWDFGGQEFYHATHPYFLTDHALFLLVWNARLGWRAGRLSYWLEMISVRAPNAPILLVATHLDEHAADLPLAELRARFPQLNILASVGVSNKTSVGIDALREEVRQRAAELPRMGELWPQPWVKAAGVLESIDEPTVGLGETRRLWRSLGVDEQAFPVLLRWLHELGDLLYFADDEELADLVILRPTWVSEMMNRVMDSRAVTDSGGLLTKPVRDRLWADVDFSVRAKLLRLMERFDLGYRLPDDPLERLLIPERLPADPPPYEAQWDRFEGMSESRAVYHFKSSVPAGIPSWFIARSHRFSLGLHWHSGVLLADTPEQPQHLALLRADRVGNSVELCVRGPYPAYFFSLLKDGLMKTLSRYPGLSYDVTETSTGNTPAVINLQTDVLQAQLEMLLDRQAAQFTEGVKLIQRLLLKTASLSSEEYCPNAFLLTPVEGHTVTRLFRTKSQLHLLCQAPGCWHLTDESGAYEIDNPQKWLRELAPALRRMARVVRLLAPVVGPFISVPPEIYETKFRASVEWTSKYFAQIENETHAAGVVIESLDDEMQSVTGAELRALRVLLEELDGVRHWGGLEPVRTPEGDVLWLCPHHRKAYA